MKTNKAYEVITDRMIDLLEKGTVPWRKPWAGHDLMPANLISKKNYRGINVFLLAAMTYDSPYWLTFNQAKQSGGTVRKGEKACPVVFWKWLDDKKNPTSQKKIPMLRYYHVFNAAQCDGLEDKVPVIETKDREFNPIAEAEALATAMPQKPELTHSHSRAFYRPTQDLVNVPRPELFNSDEEYYSTLFHELVHSTGHEKRLGRHDNKTFEMFASNTYSQEELVAEMGCAYMCGTCGIMEQTIDNSAAYISGWLKQLKNDKAFVIKAAGQAQKAVDYILGSSPVSETSEEKGDSQEEV